MNQGRDIGSQSRLKFFYFRPYINMGRFIIRAIVAFQDLYSIFNEGVIRVDANWPTDPDEEFDDSGLEGFQIPPESEISGLNQDVDTGERDLLYKWFCQIYRAFPKLTLEIIASKGNEYTDLIGELVTGGGYARSTDLHAVHDLLPSWFPNIQSVAKCSRGFFNHHTAMLLRPANVDADDSAAMKMYATDESLSFPPAAELPRFLYSGNPETVVDVDRPSLTILRGPHHFASYCRIYQSDKTAINIFTLDGKGDLNTLSGNVDERALSKRNLGTSVSVGKQCKISCPTPHAIAYAGCLLRAALSSTEKLMESEDSSTTYSYSTLYREIVDTVTPGDCASTNRATDAIMTWWTNHAYPTKQTAQHPPPARLSARERMKLEAQNAGNGEASPANSTAADHPEGAVPRQPTSQEQGIIHSNGSEESDEPQANDGGDE
ncbi:hypothetical protein M407DRAFT_29649 [Tulasnella calospora MUT 4182]|uniref:Uncharacterized protein n=1 Tax=Tulasnella calospora MUT 4182 TaxID=1051891 RepID=A0A0C3KGT4_9AGAM|nr:hypothetical protein M407DRAFT_29649 [Tulasnella calospora MUT 4182]